MTILGRDSEVARLDSDLESLRTMSARLLFEGEAGIGKTTLLTAGIDAAEARGYTVLTTRPSEADQALPWAGLADLVTVVPDAVLAELPVPQRRALEVALLRRAAEERASDPRAVFSAFLSVVGSLVSEAPVVVAIDDLQWLDPPTSRALAFFGRRMSREGTCLLAAARARDGPAAAQHVGWFAQQERLQIAPLTAGALHHLVRQRFDVSLPRPALIRLHRMCAGNAFYALEIVQQLSAAGPIEAHGDWPLPADVHDLVRLRVAGLPVSARRRLLRAAAAAQPTEALIGERTLAAAEASGLIRRGGAGRVQFAHPLYAEAVYANAAVEERRGAHASLAKRELDPVERARHLALATSGVNAQVAAELDAAAEHARGRGAPDTAAQLMEHALELTPEHDREAGDRRAFAAARDWFHSGSLVRSRELLTQLLEQPPTERLLAQTLHLLALVHFREESIPLALERLHEAAAAAGEAPDLRAPVELELAFASVSVSFDYAAARPHAERALACAEQLDDPGLLAQALAVKTMADFLLGDGIDEARLARALELEDPDDTETPVELRPTLIAGSLALYEGSLERARALLHPLRASLRERGGDTDLPILLSVIIWLACWAGHLDEARAAADEAVELARISGSEALVGYSHAHAALADAYAGREASCRAHVEEALSGMARSGFAVHATWSLSALGLLELSRGDTAAAAATYAPLLEVFEEFPAAEPVRAFFLPDAIEALVAVAEVERAARLTDSFMDRARALERDWALAAAHRCRALIAAATGSPTEAAAAIDTALELHERLEMPLEVARSLLVKGQIERRARRKAAARESLERAEALCAKIGAEQWAERVRAELARLDGTPHKDDLSPTERRVAQLAASGLTNREIAAAAFITEKTVEANLSRIYRKLGVRSRTELALRLLEDGDARISTG